MIALQPLLSAVLALARGIPVWAWALAAALAWGGIQHHRATTHTRAQAQAEQRAAVEAATAAAQADARAREHEMSTRAEEAADAYRFRLAAARRAADSARGERERLLDATAGAAAGCRAAPSASAPGGVDDAAELRVVVRECAAALYQVAEAADAGDSRIAGLQAYIRAIGAAPSAPATGDAR